MTALPTTIAPTPVAATPIRPVGDVGPAARRPARSLLDRVGGPDAVDAAVQVFYGRVLLDPLLAPFFYGLDMTAQRKHLRAFLVTALGGPAEYRGRDLGAAHAHLRLTDAHFDGVAGHLVGTLETLGVAQDVIDDIVAAVAPLRSLVVSGPSV